MKKFLTLAVIMLLAASYSLDITRHRVTGLVGMDYMMQDSLTVMGLNIPAVGYQFEAKPSDMFKLYLYGNLGYKMTSYTWDGEAADESEKDMDINLNPMGKVYLPNNLFVKIGLPFMYNSNTAPVTDAEAMSTMSLDLNADFGFDNREIYIHGLTPWDEFQKGILAYAFYDMGIMGSYDMVDAAGDIESVDVEDFASYFGIAGCYAHYADAMMIMPYLQYRMQLNEDAGAKDADLNIGLTFVKDFNEQINLEAGLNYMMVMPEDSDVDGASDFNIEALVNYYVMPELDIFAGLGYWMDMTKDNETEPAMGFKLGAEYTLNLLK